MQSMLLCIINVVNPKMYNPENQLHLFPVAELCFLPAFHLKGGNDGWAGVRRRDCKQEGHFGSGCCQDSVHFPDWKRQLVIAFHHQPEPTLFFCLCSGYSGYVLN